MESYVIWKAANAAWIDIYVTRRLADGVWKDADISRSLANGVWKNSDISQSLANATWRYILVCSIMLASLFGDNACVVFTGYVDSFGGDGIYIDVVFVLRQGMPCLYVAVRMVAV